MSISIPKIKPLASLKIEEPELHVLDNGIEVFGFNGAGKDIMKLDVVFKSGRWAENKQLVASFCSSLIKSGNKNQSAFELAESIDFLGGTINASMGYNSFTIHLYCLTRHFEDCLKLFLTVLNETQFPVSELQLNKDRRLSQLKVNQLKNDYVGDMVFKEKIFGKDHPYGYRTTAEAIKSVNQYDLFDYYRHQLSSEICHIGLAGRYSKKEIDLLNKYVGNNDSWDKKTPPSNKEWIIETSDELKEVIELPNSVQASLFIGNLSISRKHEDYITFALLNMIYGGYFGSRLMSNLREDKGLTYGVYSYSQNFNHASAFIINTETALKHLNTCLEEIYFEMNRLKDQLVPDNELLMARNYFLGRLLDQVDGPFKSAATFSGLKGHGLSMRYLKTMEGALLNINPKQLLETAQKYLVREKMFEVVVK